MKRFLRYVVKSHLEGCGGTLKERLIGIEVFDRPADWDSKVDTIVRSEARRLRSKLEAYYSGEGLSEDVRIAIPKGGYVPVISFPESDSADAAEIVEPIPLQAIFHPDSSPRFYQGLSLLALPAIVLSIAWIVLQSSRATGLVREDAQAIAETIPFANEIGPEVNPSISPDGKRIAYAWDGNSGDYRIYVKRLESGAGVTAERLTHATSPEFYPSWSPDGGRLALLRITNRMADVVVRDLSSGAESVIAQIEARNNGWVGDYTPFADIGPRWTPDGQALIVADSQTPGGGHRIDRVSLRDGSRTSIQTASQEVADYFPRVSPDGRQLAFARYVSHGVSDLFVCSMAGGASRQLTFERRGITGLAWDQDGKSIYYTAWRLGSPRIWKVGISGGQPEPLADTAAATDIAVSPNGKSLVYAATTENWNIWRIPLRESSSGSVLGTPQRFIAASGRNHGPSFSPDGRFLAFISDRAGPWAIWLADANGNKPRKITNFDWNFLGSVNWTPDSKRIAFDARPHGNAGIYMMDIDPLGEARPLGSNKFEERMPSFSADGTAIYFNSNRDGVVAVWRKPLNGNPPTRIGLDTSFKSLESSADGEVYFNTRNGKLFHASPEGKSVAQIAGVQAGPEINWTTGRQIYFTHQNPSGQIEFLQVVNNRPKVLLRTPGQLVRNTSNLTVSPDRNWLLYAQQDHFTSDLLIRRIRR